MSERRHRPPLPTPHPAKAIIVGRGLTVTHVANAIGYGPDVVGQVLNRRRSSSERMRRALCDYLELPESECFFDTEAVAS